MDGTEGALRPPAAGLVRLRRKEQIPSKREGWDKASDYLRYFLRKGPKYGTRR